MNTLSISNTPQPRPHDTITPRSKIKFHPPLIPVPPISSGKRGLKKKMEAHIDRSIALYPRNYRNFQFIAPRFTERLFALIAALFVRFFIAGLKSRQCDIAVELQKLWKSGPGGPRYPFWGSFSLPIAGYKYARDTVSRRPSDDIPCGTCESRPLPSPSPISIGRCHGGIRSIIENSPSPRNVSPPSSKIERWIDRLRRIEVDLKRATGVLNRLL